MRKSYQLKTIAALLLACLLILPVFCGCSQNGDIPRNMQEATAAGSNYRLYVPKNWSLKVQSGVSGAYVTLVKLSDVSMYQRTVAEGTTAADVWETCSADYAARWSDFKIINHSENTVGGQKGLIYVFSMTYNGELVRCMQVSIVSGTTAYVFIYVADNELYESYIDQVYEMVSLIKIDELPYPCVAYEAASPASVPAGMYCISGKNAAYYLFVPTDWDNIATTEIVSAKSPDGLANVSLTVFMDNSVYSMDSYWERAEEEFKSLPGYQYIDMTEVEMGGARGRCYTFSAVEDGVTYRMSQTIVMKDTFLYGPACYILTYTAAEENFDANLSALDQIRQSFVFR